MMTDISDPVSTAAALVGFARVLNVRLRDAPQSAGLALAELQVLAGIDRGFDLSSTLARKLLLDFPRVSRVVEGFVESGDVVREPDPEDRRRSRLRLTPSGQERLSRGQAELAAAMEDLMKGLSEQEREGLERAVPGMRRVLAARIGARSEPDGNE